MDEFVTRSLCLLRLEKDAEEQQNEVYLSSQLHSVKHLEAKGVCIQKLQVTNQRVGLYGRQVASFELACGPRQQQHSLPSSSITTGCIVAVFANCKRLCDDQVSGVVVRSSSIQVQVAFDDLPADVDFHFYSGCLQLVKIGNHVTYNRMKLALERLKSSHLPFSTLHLAQVLFAEAELGFPDPMFESYMEQVQDNVEGFSFNNSSLDLSQKKAVLFALSQPEVAIIHGPPGTGKTTTVLEVILQAMQRGTKVLACAPSNIAVDNLAERLAAERVKVVRIGHPARLVESVQNLSLDALLTRTDSALIIQDVKKELEQALEKRGKSRAASDKRKWGSEIKTLRKELKSREEKAVVQLLGGADVVLATTTGASLDGPLSHLPEGHFGMTVIDECAQAIEASCWIPLIFSSKCVLAGDHKQLPPTIISHEAAGKGLSTSLMERLITIYGNSITRMLTTQYRMNQQIMQWSSDYLYEGLLQAHSTVADHRLSDLDGVSSTCDTDVPLLFIDTAGLDIRELDTPDEESKGNEGEADLVIHHLKNLLEAGVAAKDVAVIAPYNLQVELIRKRLQSFDRDHSRLEVKSVDGFQGREKEAIIISFTRSNLAGDYGFLEEMRRTNVAVTRARRHLTVIGDSDTLSHEPFLSGLLEYCSQHGEVRGAQDYLHASGYEELHLYETRSKSSAHPKAKSKPSPARPAQRKTGKVHIELKLPSQTVRQKPEEDEEVFRSQLKEFLSNESEEERAFPASLSGYQRKYIHEVCEEMGLNHVSEGVAPERYIMVSKPKPIVQGGTDEAACPDPLSEDEVNTDNSSELDPESSETEKLCSVCSNYVPLVNLVTHEAHCSKSQQLSSSASDSTAKSSKKPTGRKQRKSQKTSKPEPAVEDLDTLLAEMTVSEKTCNYPKCKRRTNLLGVRCSLCRKGFCVEHSIPEVHGCGEAAKLHARRDIKKPTRNVKPSSSASREVAHKQLERKIEKLSSERKSKAKSKSK